MLKKNWRGLRAVALALAFTVSAAIASLGGLASTAPSARAETITVTDVLGRSVDVPSPAERVLLGFYYEDFLAIVGPEAYDRVVAISKDTWHGWRNLQWQAYSQAIPRIEELIDVGEVEAGTFSLETAVAARPDVAILAKWQYSALGDAVNKLEAAGIPVVVVDYNAQTVEMHVASTRIIGEIMGARERAEQLANEYAAAVQDVVDRVAAESGERPRVYVELGNQGPHEQGNSYGDVMWGGVVKAAGGTNIAEGQVARWGPLNPEFVLAQNPELIFIAGSGWAGRDRAVIMGPGVDPELTFARLAPYLDRAGWQELEAVKSGQVHALYHGGARTLYDYAYLQYVAKTLYPEAFADVDPQATLARFFQTYLPIEAAGTYMVQLPSESGS